MINWENQRDLVFQSPSPFGCVDKRVNFTKSHSFKLDSAYNPLWDNKRVVCPPEITNITNEWTVFGVSIVSNGGLTIVGIALFGVGGITLIGVGVSFTLLFLFKKKTISIRNYDIKMKQKSSP